MATIAFFPEGAFGPTNNCVGIGDVLRKRGHDVVFIIEESFAGNLEAKGFEDTQTICMLRRERSPCPSHRGR